MFRRSAKFSACLPLDEKVLFSRIKIEGILESSLGILVTYDPSRAAPHVLGRHTIPDTGLYSVCLAIENLWLAATAENLGVGWVSFYQEEFVRNLFGIPAHIRPVAWLCLGPVHSFADIPDLDVISGVLAVHSTRFCTGKAGGRKPKNLQFAEKT